MALLVSRGEDFREKKHLLSSMVNVLHQLLLSSAPGTTSRVPSHTNPALGLGRGGEEEHEVPVFCLDVFQVYKNFGMLICNPDGTCLSFFPHFQPKVKINPRTLQ